MEFSHKSVLLNETIEALNIKPNGIYADGTAGGAGHSLEIAKRLTDGRLYALDRDPDAVKTASERLKGYNAEVIKSNFSEMQEVLNKRGVTGVDGILLDLGVSSYQLDNAERGFSYRQNAPLDMRMSKSGISAADIVNTYSKEEIVRILRDYGEEKFAFKIADRIISEREKAPIDTTLKLADIISSAVPARARRDGHPARKSFQAIRIAVNDELGAVDRMMKTAPDSLKIGGRLCVISFHSLEDRIVKTGIAARENGCTCPREAPICVCGFKQTLKSVHRKPIVPDEDELKFNPRARSAKLRVAERV